MAADWVKGRAVVVPGREPVVPLGDVPTSLLLKVLREGKGRGGLGLDLRKVGALPPVWDKRTGKEFQARQGNFPGWEDLVFGL